MLLGSKRTHYVHVSYVTWFTQSVQLKRQNNGAPTFPSALEEEPDDKHLQPSHQNHHPALHHAEVEYPRFRALDRAEIPVLSCAEIFLVAVDGG